MGPDTSDPRAGSSTPAGSNPERAEPGWAPAVIAGAYQTGVLGVRALTRRGVRASLIDCNPAMAGFHSVHGPARRCPDPDVDGAGWVRFMIDLAVELGGRPVLIPSSDRYITAIANHTDALSGHYILSPGVPIQGLLADKDTQYALAAKHGMPMPRTEYAHDAEDVARFARDAAFPCLLKPKHFREWLRCAKDHPLYGRKIAIANSPEQLLAIYEQAAPIERDVILQEIIEGPDSGKRVYLSCYDASSRRIAHAMLRELRCEPLGFGPASVTEPIEDRGVDEVCDGWLRSIGYIGLCEIEIKQDTRDGQFKLIEANARLTGSGDAAPYAGVDLCWLHYLDLVGHHVVPVGPSGRDFKHITVRSDAVAVVEYWRAGLLSWKELRRSWRPPLAFYDLDAGDWRYSAETIYIATRLLLRGLWRAAFQPRKITDGV
jgi:predicted ATP-grasp superfamily ATP-dependent carboligase